MKPSLRLKAYAYALNIDRTRRDVLLDHVDKLVTAFSEDRDVDVLARAILDQSKNGSETAFLRHGVHHILRRRFGSPYRARSVIFALLSHRCAELIADRALFPPPSYALGSGSEIRPRVSAHHTKVLLVMSDPDLRAAFAETIRSFPSDVTVAGDGVTAWTQINRINFDVIVCEFFLPALDGDALYAESKPEIRGRFIFVTGQNMTSEPKVSSFRQETNAPFVTLPCSRATLIGAVSKCLRRQSLARANDSTSEFGAADVPAADAIADQLCNWLAAKVVTDLQGMTDLLFGEETGLVNLWEEICVQRQGEQSVAWGVYAQTVTALIEAHLEDLSESDLTAIWLETDQGTDWQSHDSSHLSISVDDIVEYVAGRYVYLEAAKFSNDRIAAFLSS